MISRHNCFLCRYYRAAHIVLFLISKIYNKSLERDLLAAVRFCTDFKHYNLLKCDSRMNYYSSLKLFYRFVMGRCAGIHIVGCNRTPVIGLWHQPITLSFLKRVIYYNFKNNVLSKAEDFPNCT